MNGDYTSAMLKNAEIYNFGLSYWSKQVTKVPKSQQN